VFVRNSPELAGVPVTMADPNITGPPDPQVGDNHSVSDMEIGDNNVRLNPKMKDELTRPQQETLAKPLVQPEPLPTTFFPLETMITLTMTLINRTTLRTITMLIRLRNVM
jgi:hypothetical protein